MHWLNHNQGVTTTLLTCVLIAVAIISMKIAGDQRLDSARPILTVEARYGPSWGNDTRQFGVFVSNRGPGSELDIRLSFPHGYRLDRLDVVPRGVPLGGLRVTAPGESFYVVVEVIDTALLPISNGQIMGDFQLLYRDVFGSRIISSVEVRYSGNPYVPGPGGIDRKRSPIEFGEMNIRRLSRANLVRSSVMNALRAAGNRISKNEVGPS